MAAPCRRTVESAAGVITGLLDGGESLSEPPTVKLNAREVESCWLHGAPFLGNIDLLPSDELKCLVRDGMSSPATLDLLDLGPKIPAVVKELSNVTSWNPMSQRELDQLVAARGGPVNGENCKYTPSFQCCCLT